MNLVPKIAWRNLWRHRRKSLSIGMMLLLGTLFMTIGNGLISGMEKGLAKNIINSFSGDIVVISAEKQNDDILLNQGGKPVKVIQNFYDVQKVLNQAAFIQKYLPAAVGRAFILSSRSDMRNIRLLGVDITKYHRFFSDSMKITEGRLLGNHERGLLISEAAREEICTNMYLWVFPEGQALNSKQIPPDLRDSQNLDKKDNLVLMGASETSTGMDIAVPVKGIIKYKSLNKVWGNYSIIDIDSFRETFHYVTEDDSKVEISDEEQTLLESDNLDQMFSSRNTFGKNVTVNGEITAKYVQAQTWRKVAKGKLDTESFNVVLIKLKPGISPNGALKKLNLLFRQQHLNVRAISWKNAVGTVGTIAMMIKVALNIFIMFIFFVVSIVIMNTLSMAAIERSSELGMMRAIGARRGFLREMFICETGTLAFFFGGIGIIIGCMVIYLLKIAGISTTNAVLQIVYGGDRLSPLVTVSDLVIELMELGFVTLISVLYPLQVIGKITPLDAISRE